jgi:hypothetical protein
MTSKRTARQTTALSFLIAGLLYAFAATVAWQFKDEPAVKRYLGGTLTTNIFGNR